MFERIRDWMDRRAALRGVGKYQTSDNPGIRFIVEENMKAAEGIRKNGDLKGALQRWQDSRTLYPDFVLESRSGFFLLLRLRKFDIAESLMQEGCERLPGNPFFFEGAAIVASRRDDDAQALERYALLREKFPESDIGYIRAAAILTRLCRLDEADQVLASIAYHTQETALAQAKLRMARKDWAAALASWDKVPISHPSRTIGIAQCHREMGQLDDAEQVLVAALKEPRRKNSLECYTELAVLAEARGDWSEAARQWSDIRLRAPLVIEGYCRGALALSKCGRELDAEVVLREATERFPSTPEAWMEYARVAERRGDVSEAAVRWAQVHTKFPSTVLVA